MKYLVLISTCLFYIHANSFGQQQQNQLVPNCNDTIIHKKLVSLNNTSEQNQYKLILTKSILIPNGGLQPVTIELEAGQSYQCNFIPNENAQRVSMQVIGPNRIHVGNKKASDGKNPVSLQFTAKQSGTYIMIVSQKLRSKFLQSNKQKEVCGGVSVLKK